jgi:hypothetical protein
LMCPSHCPWRWWTCPSWCLSHMCYHHFHLFVQFTPAISLVPGKPSLSRSYWRCIQRLLRRISGNLQEEPSFL